MVSELSVKLQSNESKEAKMSETGVHVKNVYRHLDLQKRRT